MTRKNQVKISLKAGMSFAWLPKELDQELRKIVGARGRTKFIKYTAKQQFGIDLETKEDLKILDQKIAASPLWKDRSEWLRDICRRKIEKGVRRLQ